MVTRRRIKKNMELGTILEEAREERELSKSKAAKEMGVARQTYHSWESLGQVPGVEQADTIANFTGLDRIEVLSLLLRLNDFLDYDQYLTTKRHR